MSDTIEERRVALLRRHEPYRTLEDFVAGKSAEVADAEQAADEADEAQAVAADAYKAMPVKVDLGEATAADMAKAKTAFAAAADAADETRDAADVKAGALSLLQGRLEAAEAVAVEAGAEHLRAQYQEKARRAVTLFQAFAAANDELCAEERETAALGYPDRVREYAIGYEAIAIQVGAFYHRQMDAGAWLARAESLESQALVEA